MVRFTSVRAPPCWEDVPDAFDVKFFDPVDEDIFIIVDFVVELVLIGFMEEGVKICEREGIFIWIGGYRRITE
jgi:hypothetical protein